MGLLREIYQEERISETGNYEIFIYKSAQTSYKGNYSKALNIGRNAVRAQASRWQSLAFKVAFL
jgi:hypothetical protein